MTVLELDCKTCGARFPSGVPLARAHVEDVKLRTLEVCPACGAAADYRGEEYLDAGAPARDHRIHGADVSFQAVPGEPAGGSPAVTRADRTSAPRAFASTSEDRS
ncbi:MAG: hypothetical protein H0V09_01520 [Gemmatimonadetes bacterium]|nr:hypothetical protein [Gemmatimonadota bacterium]